MMIFVLLGVKFCNEFIQSGILSKIETTLYCGIRETATSILKVLPCLACWLVTEPDTDHYNDPHRFDNVTQMYSHGFQMKVFKKVNDKILSKVCV